MPRHVRFVPVVVLIVISVITGVLCWVESPAGRGATSNYLGTPTLDEKGSAIDTITRVYDVSDLINDPVGEILGGSGGPPSRPCTGDLTAEQLIVRITSVVSPNSWRPRGHAGAIKNL